MLTSDNSILKLLKGKARRIQDIGGELNVKKSETRELKRILQGLVEKGEIKETRIDGQEYYEIRKKNVAGLKYALIIILVFTLIYAYMFSEFQQIPGPLYGGDYYFHFGIVNHIYNGNPPWTCPQNQGEYAFYPWLLHLTVAVIAKITGNLMVAYTLYFPVIVLLLGGVISYFLGRELFNDEKFALLLCLGWMGMRSSVGYIPANFTPFVPLPLFLLCTLRALHKRSLKWSMLTGISFGLLTLSHASALPAAGLFLLLLYIYYSFFRHIHPHFDPNEGKITFGVDGRIRQSFRDTFWKFLPILMVGLVIAMLYWAPILFIYHFSVKNPWTDFTRPDYTVYGGEVAANVILARLFNINALTDGNIHWFILSILTSVGLIGAIRKRESSGSIFLIIAFLAGLLGFLHYIITIPLLNTHYAPIRFNTTLLEPTAFLLSVYGIFSIYNLIRGDNTRKIFLATAFIFFIIVSGIKTDANYNGKWTQAGRSSLSPALIEMEDWVKENTDKNAVFLSHEELSFALNGLTGRKQVIGRKAHYNPYVDIHERTADATVILYGNDSGKSLELLREYNISYVYWDANWLYFAYNEPSMIWPNYADYLTAHDVKFQPVNTYLDPAWGPKHKKYDVLAIAPAKQDPLQPWSDEFNKHLKLLKNVEMEGKTAYRIFQIDYESF